MIARSISPKLKYLAGKFPVLFLTGPRQSGKTTLIREQFKQLPYVSLENPDMHLSALNDPRSFLKQFPKGAILDEAQRAPELFSYIQGIVDDNKKIKFVLSGSQNFLLSKHISQSLAGRAAVSHLLPFSISEMKAAKIPVKSWNETAIKGFYPRVFDKKIAVSDFYSSYIRTYVERDVRQTLNIADIKTFNNFLKLCAGRAGQIINHTSLANDAGVSPNTVKAWLSVLEASFIIFFLHPYHNNFNKRIIRSSKMYFCDTGLLCHLLELSSAKDVLHFYMKGAIYENLIIAEMLKARWNAGLEAKLYYWRDQTGNEIDCLFQKSYKDIQAFEIKSGETFNNAMLSSLLQWQNISKQRKQNLHLVYAGKINHAMNEIQLHGWNNLDDLTKSIV